MPSISRLATKQLAYMSKSRITRPLNVCTPNCATDINTPQTNIFINEMKKIHLPNLLLLRNSSNPQKIKSPNIQAKEKDNGATPALISFGLIPSPFE